MHTVKLSEIDGKHISIERERGREGGREGERERGVLMYYPSSTVHVIINVFYASRIV